jgi:hypothetical protein
MRNNAELIFVIEYQYLHEYESIFKSASARESAASGVFFAEKKQR